MFDDLVRLGGLAAGDRVVEIGSGTGQATVPLAERGLRVTAVELGAALAAVARRRTAGFPGVSVAASSFEDWHDADDTPVRAVVSFNALHWIDPATRYAKPAALLAPGGVMAVGGCRWARPANARPTCRRTTRPSGSAGSPPPPEQIGAWHFPGEARGYFDETASLRYPFQQSWTTEEYLAQLGTQSGAQSLGPARAADFLARVRRRLLALGSPSITVTFVGFLAIGTRRPG